MWWHADTIHSVGAVTDQQGWGNVMYIPAAPYCEKNAAYAQALRPGIPDRSQPGRLRTRGLRDRVDRPRDPRRPERDRAQAAWPAAVVAGDAMTTPTPRPGRTRAAAIRRYTDGDRDAVYEVGVRTGAAGQDASGRYVSDDLIGDIYATAYLYLEPELAFVLADGDRAVGYVLGTADTSVFVTAYRARWLPLVSPRYPAPEHSADPAERRLLADLLNPRAPPAAGIAAVSGPPAYQPAA